MRGHYMPENVPDGSVVITPSEQYQRTAEQFGTITERLGDVQRTLHPMAAQVAEHDAYINTLREAGLPGSVTALQTEVKQIDRTLVKWAGIVAGGVGLLSILGNAVVQSFMK